jgi:hypothetical protein
MEVWLKIAFAVVLGIIVIRLWPAVNHMLKHGPKGTSDDWRSAIIALALVVGFVVLLILMVRN